MKLTRRATLVILGASTLGTVAAAATASQDPGRSSGRPSSETPAVGSLRPIITAPAPPRRHELPFGRATVTPTTIVAGTGGQDVHVKVELDRTPSSAASLLVRLYRPGHAARNGQRSLGHVSVGTRHVDLARLGPKRETALTFSNLDPPPGRYRLDILTRKAQGDTQLVRRAHVLVYAQHRLPAGGELSRSLASGGALALIGDEDENNVSAMAGEQVETFVAVQPNDPSRVIAGAVDWLGGNSPAWISNDFMRPGTEVRRTLPSSTKIPTDEGGGTSNLSAPGDPALAADRLGNLWYANLGGASGAPPNTSYIVINRVAAGTTTFQADNTAIPRLDTTTLSDKPMITIDNWPASPKYGRLYAVWVENSGGTQRVVISECDTRPGGVSTPANCDNPDNWTSEVKGADAATPTVVSDADSSFTYPSVAVSPSGAIHVAWWNAGAPAAGGNEIEIDHCFEWDCKPAASWGADTTVEDLHESGGTGIPFSCPIVSAPGGRVGPQPYVDVDKDSRVYVSFGDLRANGTVDTTGNIAFDASAATVQTALEGLSNVDPGDVAVAGPDGGPYSVTFGARYSIRNVPELSANGALLTGAGATVSVSTTQPGGSSPPTNEVQQITLTNATGGTFTLGFAPKCTATSFDPTFDVFIARGAAANQSPPPNSGVRLSDDAAADKNDHFFPTLTADQTTGEVQSSFYSTKADPTRKTTHQYAAISTNSGASYGALQQITTEESDYSGASSTGFDYGDYQGADSAGGRLFPVWSDNRDSEGGDGELFIYSRSPNVRANGRIAFDSQREGFYDVFSMNPDGAGQTNLTNNSAFDAAPAWSPDGTRIAFESARDGNVEIYTMDASGANQTRITNSAGQDFGADWSPDGTKITFTSERDGNREIYTMKADGTDLTRLTNNAVVDGLPAWSPDGTKIAFARLMGPINNYEIFTMNTDGSGESRITNNAVLDSAPDWSPSGTKIAVEVADDTPSGIREIFVMNSDGSGRTNLTNSPDFDLVPAWSPDGTKITFERWAGGGQEIYVMNADGSGQVNLTNNPAGDHNPDWGSVSIPGGERLTGKKLTLKSSDADASRKRLTVLSKDGAIGLGGGNGSGDDPTTRGGTLRVLQTLFFDNSYDLPAAKWSYIGEAGQDRGYRYKDRDLAVGPIKLATVKPGQALKVSGKGAGLGHTLGLASPDPVQVVLMLGSRRYCMSFGGTTSFTASTRYVAVDAPAPAACPP